MVKSVSSVVHRGLSDWIVQRLSAILIAIYSIGLMTFIISHPNLSFFDWHDLFARVSMKIATLLFLLAILYHAWIGIWTIWTDYVKCFIVRSILNVLVLLMLASCFLWGLMILWSI